jgi:hypothetical protein
MNTIHHLNLQSAYWREIGNCRYPALELEIDGKLVHIYDPSIVDIEHGFVRVMDIKEVPDLESVIPGVELEEDFAKSCGYDVNLKMATNDPKIVALARDFWNAINTRGAFICDRKVYPRENQ